MLFDPWYKLDIPPLSLLDCLSLPSLIKWKMALILVADKVSAAERSHPSKLSHQQPQVRTLKSLVHQPDDSQVALHRKSTSISAKGWTS